MTEGSKPVRRIVTMDDAGGKSVAIEDGPVRDVRTDPARWAQLDLAADRTIEARLGRGTA